MWRNNEYCVGYLRRASFDYSTNESIGTGYITNHEKNKKVDAKYIKGSKKDNIPQPTYQIEIMAKKYPINISLKPTFDTKSQRVYGYYTNNNII